MKKILSILTKYVHRATETATALKIGKRIKIDNALLTLIAVFAPFMHLMAPSGMEGFFGWKWMSSMLYAIGWPVTIICLGLIMLRDAYTFGTRFYPIKYRAYLVLLLGFYFLVHVLYGSYTAKDFPSVVYYLIILSIAIGAVIVIVQINRLFVSYEEKLQNTIKLLFKGYYKDLEEQNFLNPWRDEEYKKYVVNLTKRAMSTD